MTCKGICTRHIALKPQGTGRYADGQKRCQVCQVFLKWENFWCPSCGYRLRTRPRNVKYKSKLIAIRKTSESFLIQGKIMEQAEQQTWEWLKETTKPRRSNPEFFPVDL